MGEIKKDRPSILKHVTKSQDFDENRKNARLDLLSKVEYELDSSGKTYSAALKDVSVSGCLLLTSENLDLGSKITINIFLAEKNHAGMNVKAKVVRLNREEGKLFEYGIEFDKLSDKDRKIFTDFCFSKMYENVGLNNWPTDKSTR